MNSFQKQSQDRIEHQASGNVPDLSHLVEEVNTSDALPNQPPQQKSNPPRKSNMFFILFILGIFFLLSTLYIIGVYVNQERQLADTRGRAAYPSILKPIPTSTSICGTEGKLCCGGTGCNSGLVCQGGNIGYDSGTCVRQTPTPSCKAIGIQVNNESECCSKYTVTGANGNRYCANPPVCSNSYPTSQGCFNKAVNSPCDLANHTCRRTGTASDGKALCSCSPNATTATPTSPPGSQCSNDLQSCETQSCCSGLVCQGVAGSRVCQRPQTPPDAQCRVGGNTTATCSRIIAFRCNQWFASECLDNPGFFNDMASAIAYVNGCGQIDVVCNSGPNENKLCGDFTIYKDRCGQNVPPPATQPPQPTTQLPECRNIKIYRNNTVLTVNEYNTIRPGDQLTLAIVAVNATQARFIINNQIPLVTTEKNTQGEFILEYTIPNFSQPTNFTVKGEVFGNGQWR